MSSKSMEEISEEHDKRIRNTKYYKKYLLLKDISGIFVGLFAIYYFDGEYELLGLILILVSFCCIPNTYNRFFKKNDEDTLIRRICLLIHRNK